MTDGIKLTGIWDEGYALDYYTVSSKYCGEDPFGNKIFDNTYTQIGKLLYRMKYNGKQDTTADILKLCIPFLDRWLKDKNIDCIIPVPPTNRRDIQPVFLIASAIAQNYGIPYTDRVLLKTSNTQSKDMTKENKDLTGSIEMRISAKRHCNILLIDDLFSTGATLAECTRILKTDSLIDKVYVFSVSKTRT